MMNEDTDLFCINYVDVSSSLMCDIESMVDLGEKNTSFSFFVISWVVNIKNSMDFK